MKIQIVNGVVRVADPKSARILHKEFLPANRRLPNDAALKKILAQDLDAVLKTMSPLYWYALNRTDQQAGPEPDAFRNKLPVCLQKTYKHADWDKFTTCYDGAQAGVKKAPPHGFRVLRDALTGLESSLVGGGALQNPEVHPGADNQTGQLTLFIVAPATKWSDSVPNSPEIEMREDLVRYLDSFYQVIWRQEYIKGLIDGFYSRRGLDPLVMVKESKDYDDKTPTITISRDPKIAMVNLVPIKTGELDRSIVLYNLFSTGRFNKLFKIQPTPEPSGPVPHDSLAVPVRLQPLFNSIPFAAAQAELAARGFTVSQGASSDPTGPQVLVEVDKNDPASKAGSTMATPPVTPGAGAVPSARETFPHGPRLQNQKPKSANPMVPSTEPAGPPSEQAAKAAPRDKKGYVGLGFSYLPGQGVRPIGALEYQRLFGLANIKVQAGSANELANGTGSASFDYLWFQRLHHRLNADFNGGTDTTYHRLIGTRQLNERRNGGNGEAQFELFRDPLGANLRFHADAGSQTVTLTDPKVSGTGATIISDTLVSADVGTTYVLSQIQAARPRALQIDPAVRFGSAMGGGFAKGSVAALYHQEGLGTAVFEVKAQFTDATGGTPVYELPSFGGVSSLRGFRADDELARRVWTVQPELWHGVPLPAGSGGPVALFVTENVSLAAFCDFGGAYQTYAGPSGIKAGPGAGLRVQYHQATFRLDWAYGIGTVASGDGHGRVYFSVSTPIR